MVTDLRRAPRVVIYCRVSSSGQEDNSSLKTQETACRKHASTHGWDISGVYHEIFTGAELFERPQLVRLRESVRAGEADIVLAYALDRVSRNQAHLGFLLSEWDHYGVRLELVTEAFDETPEGRLLQSVRGFVAEMERLKIRERTQRGIRARAEAGKPIVGCRPPYGYQWRDVEKSGLILDPERAPIVRRIFDAVLQGASLRSTCRILMAEGVPTPTGRSNIWEASVLHDILTHPIYTGQAIAFRHTTERRPGGKKQVRLRAQDEQVVLSSSLAPVIVTVQEQNAVLARLEANKLRAVRNNRNPEATLLRAGFARCGYCGSPLIVKRDSRRARQTSYYRCASNTSMRYGCPGFAMSATLLDAAVWSRVQQLLQQPELIALEVERRRGQDAITEDLKMLQRRIQEVATRQTKLARLASTLDDDDAAAPLLGELRALASQKRELETEQCRLEDLAAEATAAEDRLDELATWCTRVATNLSNLTYEQKRLVLEALGVRVRVWQSDHEPRWRMDMSLPVETMALELGTTIANETVHLAAD